MQEVIDLNKEIVRRLRTQADASKLRKEVSILLSVIGRGNKYASPEALSYAMGPLYEKLAAFVDVIDLDHPDLGDVFEGAINTDTCFYSDVAQLIVLAQHAVDKDVTRLAKNLWKLMEGLPKEIVRKIDSPLANRLNVRFLKESSDRQTVRASKRMQKIDLKTLCKKGSEVWNAQPNDFGKFIRFDMAYQEELVRVEKKAKRYADLGCTAMHAEIMKTVDTFRQQLDESYYGFNRVTMTSAAVILAKMHKYTLYQPFLLAEFSNQREYRIVVEANVFRDYNFIVGNTIIQNVAATDPAPMAYEPRVYPLHELQDHAPTMVNEIIGLVDHFPEAAGKAIFDHFGVIVPGVNYPNENYKRFADKDGNIKQYENLDDAKKALDIILISNKHLTPIIVGEKDGKCYFISYWA